MKNETKELFKNMPAMDQSTASQFIQWLDAPDEEFDKTYPILKAQLLNVFQSKEYQETILNQLRITPDVNVEEEVKAMEDLTKEILSDEGLSNNKKDIIKTIFQNTIEIFSSLLVANRTIVTVKITKTNPDAILPTYAHPTDAGADVCAVEETVIAPNETKVVKTGLAVAIPAGYEIQVRPRSGMSLKTGLRVANAPGTIDSDYRGEVGVIMTNTGNEPYTIEKGTKIAQFVISEVPMIKWDEVATAEDLGTTERGNGGYGSTDKPQE